MFGGKIVFEKKTYLFAIMCSIIRVILYILESSAGDEFSASSKGSQLSAVGVLGPTRRRAVSLTFGQNPPATGNNTGS